MSTADGLNSLAESLNAQIKALEGDDNSPELRAVLTAAKDPKVQRALFAHLERGELFAGAAARAPDQRTPDQGYVVVFSFSPSARGINLLPPAVAAFLDSSGASVARVVDPAPVTLVGIADSFTPLRQTGAEQQYRDGVTYLNPSNLQRGHACHHQPPHTTSSTFSGYWPQQDDGACDDEW
jgi:hypothetical protein